MSGFRIGSIKVRTSTNLEKNFSNLIREIVEKRRPKTLDQRLKDVVETTILEFLRKNRIYRLLQGSSIGTKGYDLQAEFGITNSMMQEALIKIALIVSKAYTFDLSIDPKRTLGAADVKIAGLKFLSPEQYQQLFADEEPFSYTSVRTRTKNTRRAKKNFDSNPQRIRWLKWLLESNKGLATIQEDIPEISSFGIAYDLGTTGILTSRSGRAVMRPIGTRSNVDPYEYPYAARSLGNGKNFIEEIANNETFRIRLESRVRTTIKDILQPRFR